MQVPANRLDRKYQVYRLNMVVYMCDYQLVYKNNRSHEDLQTLVYLILFKNCITTGSMETSRSKQLRGDEKNKLLQEDDSSSTSFKNTAVQTAHILREENMSC